MSDPNNINPNKRYATAIAERGKFWPVDDDYLSSVGYDPASGEGNETGKYAVLTYNVNPAEISLSGDIEVGSITIKDEDGTIANVSDYTNANALNTVVVDTNGDAIVDFAGPLNVLGPEISLNGATGGDVDGFAVDVSEYTNYTIHIMSTGVTDGADVYAESSFTGTGDWAKVGHIKIDSNSEDTNELAFAGPRAYIYLRVVTENWVDGTYDADIYATR